MPTNWNDDAVFGHIGALGDWQPLVRPGTTNSLDLAFAVTTTIASNPPVRLTSVRSNANVVISWTGSGTLQAATNLTGPWSNIAGATSPYSATPSTAPRRFFRVLLP